MNPLLIDPNNHAPEVTPDDGWDDAEGFVRDHTGEATVLPPRRTLSERTGSTPTASAENNLSGLRIESNIARKDAQDGIPRLEVQEISGNVIRLEQTEPAPPKVPRHVVFHEKAPDERQDGKLQGEGREWGRSQKQSIRWVLGTGIGVTLLVILSLVMLPLINKSNAARPATDEQSLKVVNEEAIQGMDALNLMVAKQPEAEQIFRAYLKATVSDEILPLIRKADAMRETVRKNWHPVTIPDNWTPPQDTTWKVFKTDGYPCGQLEGTLPDFSKFSAYFMMEGNRLELDWKATTAFGTATFAELSTNQAAADEIRGLILPADFYTTTWPEEVYQSYRLCSPSDETAIWCYARRSDVVANQIAGHFQRGDILQEDHSDKRITVRLGRGPESATPNQWLIEEMLHIEWITP